jgi:hypothetical protein
MIRVLLQEPKVEAFAPSRMRPTTNGFLTVFFIFQHPFLWSPGIKTTAGLFGLYNFHELSQHSSEKIFGNSCHTEVVFLNRMALVGLPR